MNIDDDDDVVDGHHSRYERHSLHCAWQVGVSLCRRQSKHARECGTTADRFKRISSRVIGDVKDSSRV